MRLRHCETVQKQGSKHDDKLGVITAVVLPVVWGSVGKSAVTPRHNTAKDQTEMGQSIEGGQKGHRE